MPKDKQKNKSKRKMKPLFKLSAECWRLIAFYRSRLWRMFACGHDGLLQGQGFSIRLLQFLLESGFI